tara:strand:+ start:803 stop:1360 length:558 start_codon:yes stop_codon:yes gene_type:complete
MILPSYYIKNKILAGIVAPHGITDLIHASQNNKTQELLSMNAACVLTSIGLSQNEIAIDVLNIVFIGTSVIHFRHDFPVLYKKNYQELQGFVLSFISIITFVINHNLFFYYMCLIHVPKHYYFNRNIINKNMAVNLSFILSFTLLLFMLGAYDIAYTSYLYPFYKGIVISHVFYQEAYVHNSLFD